VTEPAVRPGLAWLTSRGPSTPLGKERLARLVIFGLFVALFVAHARLLRPVLQNGDSAVYNEQIEAGDFSHRVTHFGYFALGGLFNHLPFGTELNMNVMVLTFGVCGLAGVYFVAQVWSGSRWLALGSVPLALGLPSALRGMLLSEVDIVAASLVVIAYALLLRNRALLAGLTFGLAVLVTPLSGPMLLVFVLTVAVVPGAFRATVLGQIRRLLKFGLAACLVYLPPILSHYTEYVYGGRGLMLAPRENYSLPERLARSWGFATHEARLVLPLCAVGAVVCLASRRIWRTGQPVIALVSSFFLMAIAGQRFSDVPVQLPNLLLLMALPPVAMAILPWGARLGLPLLAIISYLTLPGNYQRTTAEVESHDRTRRLLFGIREQSLPQLPLLVGPAGWGQKRMFERYAATGSTLAPVFEEREFFRNVPRFAADNQYRIWFLRRAPGRQLAPLLGQFTLETRTVEGRAYQVLTPARP